MTYRDCTTRDNYRQITPLVTKKRYSRLPVYQFISYTSLLCLKQRENDWNTTQTLVHHSFCGRSVDGDIVMSRKRISRRRLYQLPLERLQEQLLTHCNDDFYWIRSTLLIDGYSLWFIKTLDLVSVITIILSTNIYRMLHWYFLITCLINNS